MAGITLYLQAAQDLSVEDRLSRTQYQYSLEHPDATELALWSGRLLDALRHEPALQDVATDEQNGGLRADVTIDRDTASRLGITAGAIDDALYSAFGQRQIATIFTQLNQYHVILELLPQYRRGPDALNDVYVASQNGGQVPLSAIATWKQNGRAAHAEPPGAVPGGHAVVQPGAGRVARRGRRRGGTGHARHRVARRRSRPDSRARRARSSRRSPTKAG